MKVIKMSLNLITIIIFMILVTSCNDDKNLANQLDQSIATAALTIAKSDSDAVINENDFVIFTLLNGNTLTISKDRIGDGDVYGVDHIDNKWELSEIEDILNAIKGNWTIDDYVGFAASTIYYLPERFDNVGEDVRSKAQNDYDEKVENAKIIIPDVYFSVKEYHGKDSDNNYIYVNDNYLSPISIVLSLDRSNDSYPIFRAQTAISGDFFAEYPVLYINFFIREDRQTKEYKPATLVITSDNRFYILIDGAFYSLIKQ